MIRAIRSELIKLWRPRPVVVGTLVVTAYAIASAALVLAAARPAGSFGIGPSTASLSKAGGGTEVFTRGLAFAGFFVLVLFIGAVAMEFSRGTVRTMTLRQPDRLRLLTGKLLAMLGSAALVLAWMELVGWITARLLAGSQGVDAGGWASAAGLRAGVADYATVLYWITGYALLGTALAILIRSVPIALAVGVAWAGPFEHIVAGAWHLADRVFPGLLLESVVGSERYPVSPQQAFLTSLGYTTVAATVAAVSFVRRDVA
jgi:hypothetical protein